MIETVWEKEKLLIMSNFSFSHTVFKRLELQTRKNKCLFGKELNTLYDRMKLFATRNFALSNHVFYPFGELSVIFIKFKIVIFKLIQIGRVESLSFVKSLNSYQALLGTCTIFFLKRISRLWFKQWIFFLILWETYTDGKKFSKFRTD